MFGTPTVPSATKKIPTRFPEAATSALRCATLNFVSGALTAVDTKASITNFEHSLREAPPAVACALATRAALRVTPLLVESLHLNGDSHRAEFILPCFRLLATVTLANTSPTQGAPLLTSVSKIARTVGDAAVDTENALTLQVYEYKDMLDDQPLEVHRFESSANAFGIAQYVVSAIASAVQVMIDYIDSSRGIGSHSAVYEAAIHTLKQCQHALESPNSNIDMSRILNFVTDVSGKPNQEFNINDLLGKGDDDNTKLHPHIVEYWNAIERDLEYLQGMIRGSESQDLMVLRLFCERLWMSDMPVWAGRKWAEFKGKLPDNESWIIWTDWYESRLMGRPIFTATEVARLTISEDSWEGGPQQANSEIARITEKDLGTIHSALSQGFEDIDEVKNIIDLIQHKDRIQNALGDDPSQVIGATKDMLEATMKTILRRQGKAPEDGINFPKLVNHCFSELGLKDANPPKTDVEKHLRRILSGAEKTIHAINELRNCAGTGHGRPVGEEPAVNIEDSKLIASMGMVLAAWLVNRQRVLQADAQDLHAPDVKKLDGQSIDSREDS